MTNLVLKQGTGRPIRIANVKDSNGVLITNWTGYSVKAQVRERVESAAVLYEWTSQGVTPNVSFDGSDIVLEVDAAVTSAWTWLKGRYDVELTNPAGIPDRIAEGHLTISRETTR
jgi:hypothetical protein